MTQIPDAYQKVPMMFRAQVDGRCQLQRIYPARTKAREPQDVELWVDEWVGEASDRPPNLPTTGNPQPYEINWRFVTNGGQDDGIIRPVIGAYGWPFYPGSSMKGVFRAVCRAVCTPEQTDRYCGKELPGGDFQPGILRFHGGYPTSTDWTEGLVDMIHPQQERQVQREKRTRAFAQISLRQPHLRFGISSTVPLDAAEWETVWQLWETALARGLGCRVSAGYGQVANHTGEVLFHCTLQGQGQAAKLIDQSGEFRPNIFRAALRGHALRLFGGLTSAEQAERLVDQLFGSVRGSGDVGLLAMSFQPGQLTMGRYGRDRWQQPTYDVEGDLYWMLNRPLDNVAQRQALSNLARALMHFAMVFGGFGKSWRRADHRLFHKDYAELSSKPLIGCHWQWGEESLTRNYQVRKLESIPGFLNAVRAVAQTWVNMQTAPTRDWAATWREAWHPDKVQVWGRLAAHEDDSIAIHWLHGPYRRANRDLGLSEGTIKNTSVTGQMGKIGRLWHRMYPIVQLKKRKDDPTGKPFAITPAKGQYLELLTLFPDQSSVECRQFLKFLQNEQPDFVQLWPQ
ncbi:MAG: RAMP superfamily protein [Tildeniella torsiva UHER 1998/13D]|jgi:CRISPR-associated protein Cmr6|nr:RAMP superfamily protein [Tildeniella torsiva UHER 1998/13D]